MTLESAILSFYLLFPVWNESQEYLIKSAQKLSASNNQGLVRNMNYFLEHPRLAINDADLVISGMPNLMEELGMSAQEILFSDEDGKLRTFEYGIEKLSSGSVPASSSKNSDFYSAVVSSNDKLFTQTLRDKNSRVVEKTTWQNASNSNGISIVRKTTYKYDYGSDSASLCEKEDYLSHMVTRISYNQSGKETSEQSYVRKDGTLYTVSKVYYSYDKLGRISSVSNNSFEKGIPNTKTVYKYTNVSTKPDSSYYEDGVLRIQTVYSAENLWEVTTFFDRRYKIIASYDNGRKICETVYLNGNVQRTRIFND